MTIMTDNIFELAACGLGHSARGLQDSCLLLTDFEAAFPIMA